MTTKHFLALLRGINVGGKNIIKMTALRACFEKMGLDDIRTYIQSGNVIFRAKAADGGKLEGVIEKALARQFKYDSRVVIVPRDTLQQIVGNAPKKFGQEPEKFRYDVIFLKKPLTPAKAMGVIQTRDGVDAAHAGKHALYFSRLISRASQSRLSKIVQTPEYQQMTIRNWNTTTKLLAMME